MAKIGVISDTHLPRGNRRIPEEVFSLFEGADLILHAGDFVQAEVLYELGAIAPVKGVLGNCDTPELARQVPVKESIEVEGVLIGMIHDSGDRERRRKRMTDAFPGHRVVVFGHSHMPVVDDDGDLLLLNPGSACDPRRAKTPTVAILDITDGKPSARLVEL
ncbi:MAG TPA: metallophosphoesterase family protein [Actinomycetota bacterium]|jgi:putative phosphoesterase|nr:metallophosphoesterase family protein [Actinomycetota bacterium]